MEIETLNENINYYELYHVYENENQDDVIKFIGIFHSPKEAWLVIKSLRNKPGFKQYSQKCFWVCKTYIDMIDGEDGFVFV